MTIQELYPQEIVDDIEYALRLLIGLRHNHACNERSRKFSNPEKTDRLYEQALNTYREVIGKEPTTSSNVERILRSDYVRYSSMQEL